MRIQQLPTEVANSYKTLQSAPVLVYANADFIFQTDGHSVENNEPLLDLLESGWQARQHLLRYQLDSVKRRKISNQLFADFNPSRFSTRRFHADTVQRLDEDFNPANFHFGKADIDEITLHLWHESWGVQPLPRVQLFINVSPIDRHHYVIVPDCQNHFNQCLTPFALTVGLHLLLLTPGTRYRLGFNSLMAFASVNHLHLHLWRSEPTCLAMSIPIEPLDQNNGLYTFSTDRMPVRTLVFEFNDNQQNEAALTLFISRIMAAVIACQRASAPHNLVAGRTLSDGRLRVCLFPRRPARFCPTAAFCVAVAELSGQLIVQDEDTFNRLEPQDVLASYAQCSLEPEKFEELLTLYRKALAAELL